MMQTAKVCFLYKNKNPQYSHGTKGPFSYIPIRYQDLIQIVVKTHTTDFSDFGFIFVP